LLLLDWTLRNAWMKNDGWSLCTKVAIVSWG
jgi:hypothetical protein